MKTITIADSRINRDNSMGGNYELCNDLVRAQGINREFKCGCIMTWNSFETTAYRSNDNNEQIDIVLDFNAHKALITIH